MNNPLSIGFNVDFPQAIQAAEVREVVLPDKYYGELQGIARQKAFSIAGIASMDQLNQVKQSLDEAIAKGISYKEWKKQILKDGVLNLPNHRLDNIYRTNMQGNYMAGKWDRFLDTRSSRPYLMYDSINDSRVRPSHLALDNIIRRWDDPFWDTHSPPLGFRCRCSLRSVTQRQAMDRSNGADKGLNKQPFYTDKDGIQRQAVPDKGWDYNPSERLAAIKQSMQDHLAQHNNPLSRALAERNKHMPLYELSEIHKAATELSNEFLLTVGTITNSNNAAIAPIVNLVEAKNIVDAEFGGDASLLRNLLSVSLQVATPAQANSALKQISKNFDIIDNSLLNTFTKGAATAYGFKEIMANVVLYGIAAEVRITTQAMAAAQMQAQELIAQREALLNAVDLYGNLTPEQQTQLEEIEAKLRELFSGI